MKYVVLIQFKLWNKTKFLKIYKKKLTERVFVSFHTSLLLDASSSPASRKFLTKSKRFTSELFNKHLSEKDFVIFRKRHFTMERV